MRARGGRKIDPGNGEARLRGSAPGGMPKEASTGGVSMEVVDEQGCAIL